VNILQNCRKKSASLTSLLPQPLALSGVAARETYPMAWAPAKPSRRAFLAQSAAAVAMARSAGPRDPCPRQVLFRDA
jgi:hypothetical protein